MLSRATYPPIGRVVARGLASARLPWERDGEGAPLFNPLTSPVALEWFDAGPLAPGLVASWTGLKAGWAFAAAGGARPIASQSACNGYPGITFDGVGNILAAAVNLSAQSALRIVFAAVDVATALSVMMELTANVTLNDGAFNINVNASAGTLAANARGTTNYGGGSAAETLSAPCVISVCVDTSTTNGCRFIRKNGTALSPLTIAPNTCGAGPFASSTLYLGARGGPLFPWAGVLGRDVLFLSGAAQDADLAAAENFVRARVGL